MSYEHGCDPDPDPYPSLGIPDSTEPVLVYRHWGIIWETGALCGPYQCAGGNKNVWVPNSAGECRSWCVNYDTYSVVCAYQGAFGSCRCGFYGVYSDGHEYSRRSDYIVGRVFGVMAAYGRVSLGTAGLRCTHARVLALNLPPLPKNLPQFAVYQRTMAMYGSTGTKLFIGRESLIHKLEIKIPDDLMNANTTGKTFG